MEPPDLDEAIGLMRRLIGEVDTCGIRAADPVGEGVINDIRAAVAAHERAKGDA